MKKEKGITLVALVITIIILLILAGITISSLTESGLFDKAKQAAEEAKYADAKENLELELLEIKTEVITKEKRDTMISDCDKLKEKDGITSIEYIDEENNKYALATYKNYTFKIDKELNIVGNEKNEITDTIITGGGKYIYNEGKISEEAKGFIGLKDANAEYSTEGNDVYMNITSDSSNLAYVGTQEKVNLTNYTKIKCLVSTGEGLPYSGNNFWLVLNDTQVTNVNTIPTTYISEKIGTNQKEYILEFDIPDDLFNKEAYIGAMNCITDVHVYKIWLERGETKILYNYGKVSSEAKGFVGINDINSEYAINIDNLFMSTKSGNYNNFTYIGTENKIDLAEYRKIRCLVTTGANADGISGNYFYLAIQDNQLPDLSGNTYKMSRKIGANQTEYNLSFDIPDECKNDDFYIGVCGCLQNIYVYKIWLEK